MEHSARLDNQMPHSYHGMTRTERMSGRRPSAKNWYLFGCKAFVHVPKQNQRSLEPKAEKEMLLSFLPHGIFRVLVSSGKIVESRNKKFDEKCFPGVSFLVRHSICQDFYEDGYDFEGDKSCYS